MAATMAGWPQVSRDAAGRIGDALLELETYYAVEPTPADLEVVDRLLNHPNLIGDQTVPYRLALAEFLLQTGKVAQADAMAHDVLSGKAGITSDAMTRSWAMRSSTE